MTKERSPPPICFMLRITNKVSTLLIDTLPIGSEVAFPKLSRGTPSFEACLEQVHVTLNFERCQASRPCESMPFRRMIPAPLLTVVN